MNLSSLYKQLKKRLRWKRRWLALGFFIAVIGGAIAFWFVTPERSAGTDSSQEDVRAAATFRLSPDPADDQDAYRETLNAIQSSGGKREVVLKKIYVCGQETSPLGTMDADEIAAMHNEFPQWGIVMEPDGKIVFTEHVDDLSPFCKDNAYFGLDKNGNLSLFEGLPANDKVIRTFFQLNIGYLESSLPRDAYNQLKEGIRVTNMAEYNSVLSTFSDFAMDRSEEVPEANP